MRLASALAVLALAASPLHAEDVDEVGTQDARSQLADQLVSELQALQQAIATVEDKLSVADAQRQRRVRAAYRILRAPLPRDASDRDRMASARRRAAARLLLERDRAERALLAGEAAQLAAQQTAKSTAAAQVPVLVLPEQIGRPAKGAIARGFGTYQHDRSKATLSRRGLDFATERNAPAWAPADGVVRYAGPIRGLDHGVILDHGDYYTVVAKLAELAIPVGTRVARGDRLGRAMHHRVYLEVRVKVSPGGLPIDPQPLLAE